MWQSMYVPPKRIIVFGLSLISQSHTSDKSSLTSITQGNCGPYPYDRKSKWFANFSYEVVLLSGLSP